MRERLSPSFAALGYRDYRLLWIGLFTSSVGSSMQQVGLGWLVVELAVRDGAAHLAPFYIGLIGLSRAIPSLSLGLIGGVLADRADRRWLLMVTQLAGGAVVTLLAALVIVGWVNIAVVMVLSLLSATAGAFDLPARNAALPRLVEERDLMSAIGLYTATFNSALVVGPLIGGALIGPIGIGGLMAVNALTYGVAAIVVMAMKPLPPTGPPRRANVAAALAEGLAYIHREPVLRWVILLSSATCLFARPLNQLLPAVAHDTLGGGPVELSWLLAGYGAGSLAGALATASLGGIRQRGRALAGSLLALGLLDVAFAAQRSFPLALLLVPWPGFSQFIFSGLANTILQTRTPDELRGRIMSVYTMTFLGLIPLGTLVLGSLGSLAGIDVAIAFGGILLAAGAGYALLRVDQLRRIQS